MTEHRAKPMIHTLLEAKQTTNHLLDDASDRNFYQIPYKC